MTRTYLIFTLCIMIDWLDLCAQLHNNDGQFVDAEIDLNNFNNDTLLLLLFLLQATGCGPKWLNREILNELLVSLVLLLNTRTVERAGISTILLHPTNTLPPDMGTVIHECYAARW